LNVQNLIDFETDIAESFNRGEIHYPVHLDNGNEEPLIQIFKNIGEDDWVIGSWRMHYKALLKGVPPEELKAAIFRGESMALNFPEYNVYGSAIVGGSIPIALGIAKGISGSGNSVWCFLGDMTAHCGIFKESREYAENFNLPINWIIEDNGVSVCTDTRESWGMGNKKYRLSHNVTYEYKSKYPHAGAGVRVQF